MSTDPEVQRSPSGHVAVASTTSEPLLPNRAPALLRFQQTATPASQLAPATQFPRSSFPTFKLLRNLGQTCHLNAVLQGLLALGSSFGGRGPASRVLRLVYLANPDIVDTDLLLQLVTSCGYTTDQPELAGQTWDTLCSALAAEDGTWSRFGGSIITRFECLGCNGVRFSTSRMWLWEVALPIGASLLDACCSASAPWVNKASNSLPNLDGVECLVCQGRAKNDLLRSDCSVTVQWYPLGDILGIHANWEQAPNPVSEDLIPASITQHSCCYELHATVCNIDNRHYVAVVRSQGSLWCIDDDLPPRRVSGWCAHGLPEILIYRMRSPAALQALPAPQQSRPTGRGSATTILAQLTGPMAFDNSDPCLPITIPAQEHEDSICGVVNKLHFLDISPKGSDDPPLRLAIPSSPTSWKLFTDSLTKSLPSILLQPAADPLCTAALLSDVLRSILPVRADARRQRPTAVPATIRAALNVKRRCRSLIRQESRIADLPSSSSGLADAVHLHNHLVCVARASARFADLPPNMRRYHANPAKFAKEVLDGSEAKSAQKVQVSAVDAEKFFREVYADARNEPIGAPPPSTVVPPPPHVPFNTSRITICELRRVLLKKSNQCAPGPDGIPYTVYKRSEYLQRILVQLFNDVVSSGRVPSSWGVANIVLIPKAGGVLNDVKELRPIALTNTVGKLFTSILARRLESFLRVNEYWDSTQKGFATATQGCIDHSFTVQQALQDARSRQTSIAVAWLDLKNAFGSISHKMVQYALRRYGVPQTWCHLVFALYNPLCARVSTTEWSTRYFPYQKGVFQGDPLSPVIFNMAFSPIIAQIRTLNQHPYITHCGAKISLTAYADDLAVVSSHHTHLQRVIDDLAPLMSWLRLTFNPKKCVGLVLTRGAIPTNPPPLYICKVPFAHLEEGSPFKFLGVLIPASGNHQPIFDVVRSRAAGWWDCISKANVSIPAKLEIFKFSLTRLRWHLTIYDWSLRDVEALQNQADSYLRKWLGLPQSANLNVLYSKRALFVPLLTTIFKSAQVSKHLNLRDNRDPIVTSLHANRRVDHRAKWQVGAAISTIEAFTAAQDYTAMMLGKGNRGREGLGCKSLTAKHTDSFARRASSFLAEEECAALLNHTLTLPTYRDLWSAIEHDMIADRHWQCALLGLPDKLLSFALSAVTNSLPTNSNLALWRKLGSAKCPHCDKLQTLGHILNGCNPSLLQGRYTFRHDLVLGFLVHSIVSARPELAVYFALDYLEPSRRYTFPLPVPTNRRPDIVVSSPDGSTIWLVELTVPLPHRISVSNAIKSERYEELAAQVSALGRSVQITPLEVSSFGNVAHSARHALKAFGLSSAQCRGATVLLSQAAIRGSYVIFQHRNSPVMPLQPLRDILPPLPRSAIHPFAPSIPPDQKCALRFLPSSSGPLVGSDNSATTVLLPSLPGDSNSGGATRDDALPGVSVAPPGCVQPPDPHTATATPPSASTAFICHLCTAEFPTHHGMALHKTRFCPRRSATPLAPPLRKPLPAVAAPPTTSALAPPKVFPCPNCPKALASHQGLALHLSRWCPGQSAIGPPAPPTKAEAAEACATPSRSQGPQQLTSSPQRPLPPPTVTAPLSPPRPHPCVTPP